MPCLNVAGSIVAPGRSASGRRDSGGRGRFAGGNGRIPAASATVSPREEPSMLWAIGKAGQWLGLTVPALAVILELNHRISLGQMLMMLVAAVCCFWIGRILEGYAGS
jgi:hypothetical protein